MFKKRLNRLSINLILRAMSPLLIKASKRYQKEEDGKDNKLQFLRTNKGQGEPYLPGSSLKGLFRSHCEQIIWALSQGEALCCDPTSGEGEFQSCSQHLEKIEEDIENYYQASCPICRIFGNQFSRSRIAISDAHLAEEIRGDLDTRMGAPINRFVGNNNNLFEYEYISNRNFRTEIVIENFELWHLGLLAYLFRDLYQEQLRVGFGTNRGLGKIRGVIESIELEYFNPGLEIIRDNNLMFYGITELEEQELDNGAQLKLAKIEKKQDSIFPYYKLKGKGIYTKGEIWTLLKELAPEFKLEEITNVQSCS